MIIVTSRPGVDHFPGLLHHHSTILSALGPNHALTWVTHHGSALAPFSLNFGVPMEPEANELPKGLALIPIVTSRPGVDHFPGPLHHRSTILSALGPNYALTPPSRLTSEFRRNPKPMSSQKASIALITFSSKTLSVILKALINDHLFLTDV
ncbi:unnamed protein product [Malus baccata var. baccata]